jgi:hypothetical protein
MGKKLNNSDEYDSFQVFLSEIEHPTAYANKLKCLMDGAGMTEKEARHEIATIPIELEFYYEVGAGLMAVESGAVESGTIYSPYDGELYKDSEEE